MGMRSVFYYSTELIENNKPIIIFYPIDNSNIYLYEKYNHCKHLREIIPGFRKDSSALVDACIYERTGISKGKVSPICEKFIWNILKFAD